MKPIILLTAGYSQAANQTPAHILNCNYADWIVRGEAIPLLALNKDLAREYVQMADGLLITGGKDVRCDLYGEEQKYDFILTEPERDELELAMIEAFVQEKKPIFGICRGFQILNVYFKGSLWQDIPDQLKGEHSKGVCHSITIEKDSILHRLYGEQLEVNSYHHQGLHRLGEGLRATAYSKAGETVMVEAYQHTELPIHAVQWHPERMTGDVTNPPSCQDSLAISKAFIEACKK